MAQVAGPVVKKKPALKKEVEEEDADSERELLERDNRKISRVKKTRARDSLGEVVNEDDGAALIQATLAVEECLESWALVRRDWACSVFSFTFLG